VQYGQEISMQWVVGMNRLTDAEILLTPAEVAALFRVDPKTVTRWAQAGKLTSIRTLGGHRRYRESEVRELLKATQGN
jgi:excisionase family DNA binding protein